MEEQKVVNFIETAEQKQVFKTVRQIEWHLSQIKNNDYKMSLLDLDDLKEAEHLLDNIAPYDTDKVWR